MFSGSISWLILLILLKVLRKSGKSAVVVSNGIDDERDEQVFVAYKTFGFLLDDYVVLD